ncbi:MAG: metallophosphoesterase [Bacteroidales bacterium]|nr:metallophosphoesterase [Bacteroidales bacterium]
MKKIYIVFTSILFLFNACTLDIIGLEKGQSPDVNERFRESIIANTEYPIPDYNATRNDYQIYISTDIHARTHSERLDKYVDIMNNDTMAERLGLCLGDLITGKDLHPMVWEAFKPLRDNGYQLMVAIGNHDLYFKQWKTYTKYWPSTVYYFKVNTPSDGADLFISLDSGEGTLGLSQRKWLEDILSNASRQNYRHIIVFTHTNFFKRDSSQGSTGNFSFEETADLLSLFSRYGVDYVFTGHDHYFEQTIYNNVCYYTLNSMTEVESNPMFYRFRIGNVLTFEEVPL